MKMLKKRRKSLDIEPNATAERFFSAVGVPTAPNTSIDAIDFDVI